MRELSVRQRLLATLFIQKQTEEGDSVAEGKLHAVVLGEELKS